MLVNRKKCKIAVTELLLAAVSVCDLFGILFWFPVCQGGEMVMSCHWSGEILKGLSVLFVVLTVLHLLLPDEKLKAGMDLSLIGVAVFAMMVPGNLISLCKNAEMTCRSHTAPWTTVIMLVLIALTVVDMVLYFRQLSGKKHQRKQAGTEA